MIEPGNFSQFQHIGQPGDFTFQRGQFMAIACAHPCRQTIEPIGIVQRQFAKGLCCAQSRIKRQGYIGHLVTQCRRYFERVAWRRSIGVGHIHDLDTHPLPKQPLPKIGLLDHALDIGICLFSPATAHADQQIVRLSQRLGNSRALGQRTVAAFGQT